MLTNTQHTQSQSRRQPSSGGVQTTGLTHLKIPKFSQKAGVSLRNQKPQSIPSDGALVRFYVSMALEIGLVSPNEVRKAIYDDGMTALFNRAHSELKAWGMGIDRRYLRGKKGEVSTGIEFWFEIFQDDSDGRAIGMTTNHHFVAEFDIKDKPETFQIAIVQALLLLKHMGFYSDIIELDESIMWSDEKNSEVDHIIKSGLERRIDDAMKYVADESDFLCDEISTAKELQDAVRSRKEDMAISEVVEKAKKSFKYEKSCRKLVQTVWSWRKTNPELYKHSLALPIVVIANTYRKNLHLIKRRKKIEFFDKYIEGAVDLSDVQFISYGNSTTEELTRIASETIYGAGEQPCYLFHPDRLASKAFCAMLELRIIAGALLTYSALRA